MLMAAAWGAALMVLEQPLGPSGALWITDLLEGCASVGVLQRGRWTRIW